MENFDMEKTFDDYMSKGKRLNEILLEKQKIDSVLKTASWSERKSLIEQLKFLKKDKEKITSECDALIKSSYENLIVFSSDEKKFEQIMGYAVRSIDIGTPMKNIYILKHKYKENIVMDILEVYPGFLTPSNLLLEKKIIGLIESKFERFDNFYNLFYGLPIVKT